jgi:hypothetical protein
MIADRYPGSAVYGQLLSDLLSVARFNNLDHAIVVLGLYYSSRCYGKYCEQKYHG